jgi:hypothetical protein
MRKITRSCGSKHRDRSQRTVRAAQFRRSRARLLPNIAGSHARSAAGRAVAAVRLGSVLWHRHHRHRAACCWARGGRQRSRGLRNPDYVTRILRRGLLLERHAPAGCEGIVCNPPYKLAPQFVRHALKLVPFTAMLLRLAFLELASRTDILEGGQLARVLVFRKRLLMMHRRNWDGPLASNSIAFAWFVWRRDWCANPEIKRIDRCHDR